MKFVILILLMTFLASPLQAATIYKWVDEKGQENFTDDFNNIPSAYHRKVEIRELYQEGGTPIQPPQTLIPKKEAVKTDTYGQDEAEAHWRGKVRRWKERLEEAEANYEAAHKKFMEKSMEFSQKRFGSWSRTQYKSKIIELDRLKEDMIKSGDQIAEANGVLEKILNEAGEAKAVPNWLK